MSTINQSSEDIAVVLHFGAGSFEDGFPIRAEVFEGQKKIVEENFQIPSAPQIPELYQNWQTNYIKLGKNRKLPLEEKPTDETENVSGTTRGLEVSSAQVTNHSSSNICQKAAEALEAYLAEKTSGWFTNLPFQNLQNWIAAQTKLKEDSSVPIMFDFDTKDRGQDETLKKLPWHLWNLFDQLENAEVTLLGKFQKPVTSSSLTSPVRILAIFGSSEGGLQLQKDEEFLQNLRHSGAEMQPSKEPGRELLHEQLTQSRWDILFFAGHSFSDEELESGYLLIRKDVRRSIDDLRQDLKVAVSNGLKMAIFNSCDGLGLANFLTNLNVPTVVVFKEPVPDLVAREFLQKFLEEFSKGTPLYRAVRQARNELDWLESHDEEPCPCATWLPIILQNPNQPELVWPKKRTPVNPWKRYAAIPTVAVVVIAALVSSQYLRQQKSTPPVPSQDSSVAAISSGERLIIQSNPTSDKRRGILAFNESKFDEAIAAFRRSLNEKPNDPETLIYLNNAIAERGAAAGLHDKLEIAVSVPSFDGNQDIAQEILRGAAQAQADLNCGIDNISTAIQQPESELICNGSDGKLLVITIADDRNDVESATKIASNLDPDVLGVIGHFSSNVSIQAQKIYEQNRLVAISPTSTAVSLSNFSKYFFRTAPSDAIAAEDLANYVQNVFGFDKDQVAVAYVPNDDYSQSLRAEFLGDSNSNQYAFECDLTKGGAFYNATSCINAAIQNQAKALLLVPSTQENLLRALELTLTDRSGELKLLGGDAVYNSKTLEGSTGRAVAESGLVVAVPWSRKTSPSPFEQDAIQLYDDAINWRSAMTYDAVHAMAEGLRRQGNNPTREGLRRELASSDFAANGVAGPGTVKFEPSGDRNLEGLEDEIGVLVKVADENQDGKYEFIPVP